MKTKVLLFLAALLLLPLAASADAVEIDGIYYNLNADSKQAEVTKNPNGYSGAVDIPATVFYDGVTYDVTSIGDHAFWGCRGLTSVTIPNSVTSIRRYAFLDCFGLTSVTIPNSVTSIEEYAFYYCSSLTSVTIPNSVTSIVGNAFDDCSSLTSMIVEAGNTVYDSRNGCNAIIRTETNELIAGCQNTVIPNSVTSIGVDAFTGCRGLTSITIPNSVTGIGHYAFWNCI